MTSYQQQREPCNVKNACDLYIYICQHHSVVFNTNEAYITNSTPCKSVRRYHYTAIAMHINNTHIVRWYLHNLKKYCTKIDIAKIKATKTIPRNANAVRVWNVYKLKFFRWPPITIEVFTCFKFNYLLIFNRQF